METDNIILSTNSERSFLQSDKLSLEDKSKLKARNLIESLQSLPITKLAVQPIFKKKKDKNDNIENVYKMFPKKVISRLPPIEKTQTPANRSLINDSSIIPTPPLGIIDAAVATATLPCQHPADSLAAANALESSKSTVELNQASADQITSPLSANLASSTSPLVASSSSLLRSQAKSAKQKSDNKVCGLSTLIQMRSKLGWSCDVPSLAKLRKLKLKLPRDLDKLVLRMKGEHANVEEDGTFVYACPRNSEGRWNPYDLVIIDCKVARKLAIKYTISATNITQYNDNEISSMSATQWLWEKRMFIKLFHMKIFRQYRIWKAFNVWKINVHRDLHCCQKLTIMNNLFSTNEMLHNCSLRIRALTEEACPSLAVDSAIIRLYNFDSNNTLSLEEFMEYQRLQNEKSLEQLLQLHSQIIEIVWQSCKAVARSEGITAGIDDYDDLEFLTLNQDPVVIFTEQSPFGPIPYFRLPEKIKPGRPSYTQISEWRGMLRRLCRYLRYVDHLVVEMLRRLVTVAATRLHQFLCSSYDFGVLRDQGATALPAANTNIGRQGELVHPAADTPSSRWQAGTTSTTNSTSESTSVITATDSNKSSRVVSALKPIKPIGQVAYIPPDFDFSAVDTGSNIYDIDNVLAELNEKKLVVHNPESILSIRLVLAFNGERFTSSVNREDTDPDLKKAVTFTEPESDSSDEDAVVNGDKVREGDQDYSGDESCSDESSSDESLVPEDEQSQQATSATDRRSSLSSSIASSTIILEPSENLMKSSVRTLINEFENTVLNIPSLLTVERLKPFYSSYKFDLVLETDIIHKEEQDLEDTEEEEPWPNLHEIFVQDPDHNETIEQIHQIVDDSLEMAFEYSRLFVKYCQMVDASRRINLAEGCKSADTIRLNSRATSRASSHKSQKWTTEEFQQVLALLTEYIHEMNEMRLLQRIGFLDVNSLPFMESCLPYPQCILDVISVKLPEIAFNKNIELLNIIKSATKRLDNNPETVEHFVEHLEFLGRIAGDLTPLNREYVVVNKMYTISRDFDLIIDAEQYALYQTLAPGFQHLKSVILYAEAKRDDNIKKFSSQLNQLVMQVQKSIIVLRADINKSELLNSDSLSIVALDKINILIEDVKSLSQRAKNYSMYQERFGSSITQMKRSFIEEAMQTNAPDDIDIQKISGDISELERDLSLRKLLWQSMDEWSMLTIEWLATSFDKLNVDNLQKQVNRFIQTIYMLDKGLPSNDLVPKLSEKVEAFKLTMPGIISLCNPSLKKRHWETIELVIARNFDRNDDTFTLENLLEMNLWKYSDRIHEISTMASNECTLEKMLAKVIDIWKSTDFKLLTHSAGTETKIITGADDILTQLEESQVTIATIRGSRYVAPIKATVEEWERKLSLFGRTLEEWVVCQRNWIYLEQIFTTPDIQRQLPSESKLFSGIDKQWKDLMKRCEVNPNAIGLATASGVFESLQASNHNLEKIHKCLEDYLETKRLVFSRFYFLSNDELLAILSKSKDPDAVQPHLDKCFGNIKSIEIKILPRQPPTVKSMTSAEGENIIMPKNVRARGPVEQWLGSVENAMFDSVKKHLKLGRQDWGHTPHCEWVLAHPGQVVLTVAQIMFNCDTTRSLQSDNSLASLVAQKAKVIEQLSDLASLTSFNLNVHCRLSINALLTIQVHNRDIIFDMIDNNISDVDDFEWTRQLRYIWDEVSNNCMVLQSNASFPYGNEYLGCSPRLVITPLTDRCNLTLTGACHLNLGGSPAGPAGTGKTETVKDLAKSLGKHCIVFNCSEGLDFRMLAKFFSGLSQSGAWC